MATQKSMTIAGITYDSKSDAIRALLADGMKKSEVSKATNAHYSFVVTVERNMIIAASVVGRKMVEDKTAKKASIAALKSEKNAKKAISAAARKAKSDAKKAAKAVDKAKNDTAKAAKKAKVSKVAIPHHINPTVVGVKEINDSDTEDSEINKNDDFDEELDDDFDEELDDDFDENDDTNTMQSHQIPFHHVYDDDEDEMSAEDQLIAEILNDDIPEDVAAQMREDGLIN